MHIEQVELLDPGAQSLIAEVQAEYVVRYGGQDESPMHPSMFAPPAGALFLGRLDDVPVALGGWRFRPDLVALRDPRSAEIKRMYVGPAGRRRGLARMMLAHLERTAAESGARRMVLETGMGQPEAIALYESAGYEPVEAFGYYADAPLSRYYGKPLPRTAPAP